MYFMSKLSRATGLIALALLMAAIFVIPASADEGSGWQAVNPGIGDLTLTADDSGKAYTIDKKTPIGLLNAAGIKYTISDSWWKEYGTLYLTSVDGKAGDGDKGWMFQVNGISPSAGPNSCPLRNGDEVIFYWSESMDSTPENSDRAIYLRTEITESTATSIRSNADSSSGITTFPLKADDSEIIDALAYIRTCQSSDGGFGEEGRDTNPGTSWFAMMAIVAAGEDPHDWKVNGVSAVDYWKTVNSDPESMGTAELGKMVTLLVAAGEDPHNFNGMDYVSSLKKRVKPSGQFGDFVYTTYWGILGLASAGEDASRSVEYLKSQQADDGGYPWAEGSGSDSDNTAASIMALIAAGEPVSSPSVQEALDFLRNTQMDNGGFNYGGSSGSNAASDCWVIQAIVAAGENPHNWKKNGKSVINHLMSHQTDDGFFMWTPLLKDNPCRMSSGAVTALLAKPFPVTPGQQAPSMPEASGAAAKSTAFLTATQTVAPSSDDHVITVTDDFGNEVTIRGTPQRIISLAPSNTEILFALGLDDRIVGVTDYCNYPTEALEVERVGGYNTPNIEKILAAKPDLVVAAFGNTQEASDRLKDLGLTVIALNPESIEDVMDDITILGRATGTEERAAEIVSDMQMRINRVRETASESKETPSVVHMVWYDPLWVSGTDTFQDEMFEISNAKNAFPDIKAWGIASMENFIATDPEIIIVNTGSGMGEAGRNLIYDYVMDEPRLQNIRAVQNERVYLIDSDLIDRGGPRIIDALEEVAADIHPDLFEKTEEPVSQPEQAPGFGLLACMLLLVSGLLVWMRKR